MKPYFDQIQTNLLLHKVINQFRLMLTKSLCIFVGCGSQNPISTSMRGQCQPTLNPQWTVLFEAKIQA